MAAIEQEINDTTDAVCAAFCASEGVANIRQWESVNLTWDAESAQRTAAFDAERAELVANLAYLERGQAAATAAKKAETVAACRREARRGGAGGRRGRGC